MIDTQPTSMFPDNATQFAEVIVPLYLPKTLTWSVPPELHNKIKVGCRVEVSVGRHKKYAGIVKRVHENKPAAFDPKPILNLLDEDPVVYEPQLKLWKWIADYYVCTEGDVMTVALPAHLKLSSETILQYNEEHGFDLAQLSDNEYLVAEALEIKKELKLPEVQQLLDISHVYPVVKKLIEKKICIVWEALAEKFRSKKENYVLLNPAYHNEDALEKLVNEWSKAPKQLDLLLAFLHFSKTTGEVTQSALIKKANATPAHLKGLVEKNVLLVERRDVDRLPQLPKDIKINYDLSEAQQTALQQIKNIFNEKEVCLLHGVTGSGKTLLYINLIAEQIKQGKQALFLLPEIALTSQIIRRLQQHFGGYIAVYHSKFNANERVEIWNKVKTGEVKVVLGARSSLFMPFRDLSLIVVDEEHDASFKQHEPNPRYHARDAAIFYAAIIGAKVLLGSATPSLESYYNAHQGKFGLVELNERFGNIELPAIELIDLRHIINKDKSKVIISPAMQAAMQQTMDAGKQVILFQNRRGYSPYQICATCGWIPHCQHCDVSLSFHKATNKLHCHYCGTTYPVAKTCAACGSSNFMQKNYGTEKIEETVEAMFPDAKVARMDIDSVRGRNSHDTLIKMFEQQRVQVLVGTQMVVKGLDFDHVGLVGITDADGIMAFADFRVNERAFQLMEQVSGRAGRKHEKGHVMVQATNVSHPLYTLLQQHNYKGFYDIEIQNRKLYFYPPFSRIITIQCKHVDQATAKEAAQLLANGLLQTFDKYLNGPAEPAVNRVRNQFIFEMMLKLPRQNALLDQCKRRIKDLVVELQHLRQFAKVSVIVNVDAM